MPIARLPRLVLTAGLALLPLSALADQSQQSVGAWRQADACAREAFQRYPDYTAESNAKREAARLECLRGHRLPAPDPAPASSQAGPANPP